METVRSRSESPFTRSKVKDLENSSENGKGKKKLMKSKQKLQTNDVESDDSRAGDKDEVEQTGNEVDNDTNNTENKITNGNGIENGHKESETMGNNNGFTNNCESQNAPNGDCDQTKENGTGEGIIRVDEATEVGDIKELVNTETENCAKNDTDDLQNSENGRDADNATNGETDNFTQEEEDKEVGLAAKSTPEHASSNNSENGSHYEDAHSTKDDVQLSPDASLSSRLSTLWGKWNYSSSQEEKNEAETTSSKKTEGPIITHPYLSKVSGRRGIKEKLNLSAIGLKDEGRRTPDNSGINLDDSFRVRTNPSRLNSSEILENPTLRKFKGKRCLNASDEPEEEDGVGVLSSTKRRKLDKNDECGLLGGLLRSPFKKKPIDNDSELKLSTTESKLSKFLSPFWFWKKIASGQK